jgi:hypothetical protein
MYGASTTRAFETREANRSYRLQRSINRDRERERRRRILLRRRMCPSKAALRATLAGEEAMAAAAAAAQGSTVAGRGLWGEWKGRRRCIRRQTGANWRDTTGMFGNPAELKKSLLEETGFRPAINKPTTSIQSSSTQHSKGKKKVRWGHSTDMPNKR